MQGPTLEQVLILCGCTPQMLWDRVKSIGIGKSEFRFKYLKAIKPGHGRLWDKVLCELDKMGVDW